MFLSNKKLIHFCSVKQLRFKSSPGEDSSPEISDWYSKIMEETFKLLLELFSVVVKYSPKKLPIVFKNRDQICSLEITNI